MVFAEFLALVAELVAIFYAWMYLDMHAWMSILRSKGTILTEEVDLPFQELLQTRLSPFQELPLESTKKAFGR